MQMTDSEIVKSYKEAKEKKKQIEILAQLNACPITTIREILIASGVQFPGPKPKKAKEEKTEVVAVLSKDTPTLTLPVEKAIPEFVEKVVNERLANLREAISISEDRIKELRAEESELSRWLMHMKEA